MIQNSESQKLMNWKRLISKLFLVLVKTLKTMLDRSNLDSILWLLRYFLLHELRVFDFNVICKTLA